MVTDDVTQSKVMEVVHLDWIPDQARSHGGHLGIVLTKLCCAQKNLLQAYRKNEYLLQKMRFAPPNLKTWLLACPLLPS